MMIDLNAVFVALYRERLAELLRDPEAHAWGSRRSEAAIDVLGDDATPRRIATLVAAARDVGE